MHQKAEQGIYPSNAPLRYTNVVYDGKRLIALDPKDAQKVRTPYEQCVSGNYSLLDISKKAYREGWSTEKPVGKSPRVLFTVF